MHRLPRSPFRVMLRRDLLLFLRALPAAAVIAGLMGLFCTLAASSLSRGADSTYTVAPVAVVDGDTSFTSVLAISMLSRQEFTAPLEIVRASAEEAEAGLADGSFSAAVFLPAGFTDDILYGQNGSARVVVSENMPLHADVVTLLCRFGEELLSTGQFGVFAGQELVRRTAPDRMNAYLEKSNALFLAKAFSDPGIETRVLPYAMTGIDGTSWYLLLYAAAFFQLLILGCFFIRQDCRTELLRRFSSVAIPDSAYLGSKAAIVFGFFALTAACALAVSGLRVKLLGVVTLLPALACLSLTGMALVLCTERAVAAVTAVTAVGLFASGGILPRMELPLLMTTVGDLLPLGAAARTCGALLGGRYSFLHAGVCLVWACIGWLAMLRRLHRVRRGREE